MPVMRLIPATIITALILLFVKVADVVRGTETLLIENVQAEQVADKKPEAATTAEPGAKEEKPAEASHDNKPEAKEGEGQSEESKAKKEEPNPNVSETAGSTSDRSFSKVELEILQNLAARREELNRWEENIQIKETALDATEKRINDKIQQIEDMKKAVSEMLAQYNQQEDVKIRSLVKIYENMKPKEAARIFDELDMPILLLIIDKMSEKKAAPVLSEMDPKRAKTVTIDLAAQRRINSTKFNQPAAGTGQ